MVVVCLAFLVELFATDADNFLHWTIVAILVFSLQFIPAWKAHLFHF